LRRINWDQKYQSLAPVLMGICRRYVKDIDVAEDIVHNTFELAIHKIGSYKGIGSFDGWIKRIAINQSIQFLRDQKKSLIDIEEYKHCLSVDMSGEIQNDSDRLLAFSSGELLDVIDHLPEHHKMVFNLYVLDGYKHQEIAEMLNITIGTSKSHLSRARKKAQSLLIEKTKEECFAETHNKTWILLLFLRFDLVDLIFKKGLANFTISTGITPVCIASSSNIILPWIAPLICKLGLSVCLLSVLTGVVYVVSKNDNNELQLMQIDQQTLIPVRDTVSEYFNDSLMIKDKVIVPEVHDSISETPNVLVLKKIIVRDTIYVQKP
jgi:RNA polymerase sigma factor (sigma-70 family)